MMTIPIAKPNPTQQAQVSALCLLLYVSIIHHGAFHGTLALVSFHFVCSAEILPLSSARCQTTLARDLIYHSLITVFTQGFRNGLAEWACFSHLSIRSKSTGLSPKLPSCHQSCDTSLFRSISPSSSLQGARAVLPATCTREGRRTGKSAHH